MNRVYQFAIKLQDMFSPQMQRIAGIYEQRVGFMRRAWDKFTGMLNSSAQTVDKLRQKLGGLGSGFRVKLDSSDIDRADRKANGLWSKLRGFASRAAGGSALIGGLIGGGVAGIATSVVDMAIQQMAMVGDKTVGASQRNETTMFSLNELMGKGASKKLVNQIDQYAPERREGLIQGATKLSGAGVESSKMMATLTALNNISAITGETVSDLAMIQAKIKSTGYVQGDEINMFKERGINLNPYLAKVMGAKETDIAKLQSKGQITYDVFDKAMQAYGGKGGRFDGAYERFQSSTTQGKEESVKGRIDAILRSFGDKLLPIKGKFLEIFDQILKGEGPVVNVFKKLWSAISPVFEAVGGLMQRLGILNEQWEISEGLMSTLTFVWEYFSKVAEMAGGVLWGISKVVGWLVDSPIAALIVGLYAIAKAWGVINFVMSLNPFALVVIGISALIAGIMYAYDKFDWFREGVLKSWEMIKSVFSNIGGFLKALFTGDIAGAVAIVGKAISGGLSAGRDSVALDKAERLEAKRLEITRTKKVNGKSSSFGKLDDSPATPQNPIAAAGLNSTAGNSKSNSITINIKSLIEKSEINVGDMGMALGDLEDKIIETLVRAANSGARMITS